MWTSRGANRTDLGDRAPVLGLPFRIGNEAANVNATRRLGAGSHEEVFMIARFEVV
jgi:hypothetical protein